ncbi:LytTR family two component transcriptional regulator [Anaerobacterium chartisolvens]|uniref:Stage 0 sporulation protein A homolog n=1 Tax=Anaerobacterium chartisolvens TaxID=1297424 RepID=A0A369B4R8_9FIRM|nr:LytTR family DNA-binding domain-containing protein [Anaerobacterium chartisolvens]RCX16509.1 LytTR family two component transcriptional regulator [Anaerobacterium chartisolvens]
MLKIIIADDEYYMRLFLSRCLKRIPDVEIAGEAENGGQLVDMVQEIIPDVVFIDINMPKMDGLKASEKIFGFDSRICIIFVTAFTQYAHEAFKVYAFDYIIKPFKVERIQQTIQRILDFRKTVTYNASDNVCETILKKECKKVIVECNGVCNIINPNDIIFITRYERKTIIVTRYAHIRTNDSLEEMERRLDINFYRCHKGFIINPDLVSEILPFGHKTYQIKFLFTDESALMTKERFKLFRNVYNKLFNVFHA